MRFHHALEVRAHRANGDDRAALFESQSGVVIVLADGAGGTGGGARAAQAVVEAIAPRAADSPSWVAVLDELDASPALHGGQTTAVIVQITKQGLVGASVGDSGAWLIDDHAIEDLSSEQVRKPLLGAGAMAIGFTTGPLAHRTLLVASDGLLRYANSDAIARIARGPELGAAARQLVELVRLPSGGLQDDISIVLCRLDR